ncbi:MAG: dCTP deaminase [Candidatus Nanohaloarchaea archaeon]|nr:dCTP deaminase [Candidatus Nanohaloarchaea archaeon]
MSVLARDAIIDELENGDLDIDPLDAEQIGPASIDLTLDNKFRVYNEVQDVYPVDEDVDPDNLTRVIEVEDSILLKPGQTMHGITQEKISLPDDLCGWIEGRSRFARLGLLVHITAGFIQPGTSNRTVLEIGNVSPVPLELKPGTRICQIILQRTEGTASYDGRYRDQDEP